MTVRPEPRAKPGECFWNVKAKVEQDGGRIELGRIIWEWPGILLNAEAHAVWVSEERELVDVTPKPDGETKILFVPDARVCFPRERGELACDNVRKALIDSPLVHRLISVCEDLTRLRGGRIVPRLSGAQEVAAQELAREHQELISRLTTRRAGRNDPCPCESGSKFKHCCGRSG